MVTNVATNSVTTTDLQGGADNTFQNADEWAVGSFVITVVQYNTVNTPDSGVDHKEKSLWITVLGILCFSTQTAGALTAQLHLVLMQTIMFIYTSRMWILRAGGWTC